MLLRYDRHMATVRWRSLPDNRSATVLNKHKKSQTVMNFHDKFHCSIQLFLSIPELLLCLSIKVILGNRCTDSPQHLQHSTSIYPPHL